MEPQQAGQRRGDDHSEGPSWLCFDFIEFVDVPRGCDESDFQFPRAARPPATSGIFIRRRGTFPDHNDLDKSAVILSGGGQLTLSLTFDDPPLNAGPYLIGDVQPESPDDNGEHPDHAGLGSSRPGGAPPLVVRPWATRAHSGRCGDGRNEFRGDRQQHDSSGERRGGGAH